MGGSGGKLPTTGAKGLITLGGFLGLGTVDVPAVYAIAAVGATLVAGGILLARYGWRRNAAPIS